MKKTCMFENCNGKPLPGDDLAQVYERFDLPGSAQLRAFSFCEEHALQAAERAFRRVCRETRITDTSAPARLARLKEIEAQIKAGEKPAPRRYPTDQAGRAARLREMEAEIERGRLNDPLRELDREAARKLAELKRRREAQPEPDEIDPAAAKIRWMKANGIPFDPSKWNT